MVTATQQPDSALPRPQRARRLTSISNFAKTINLRRSTASDAALDLDQRPPVPPKPENIRKRPFLPRARKSSSGQTKDLPKSSTFSNIPRPASTSKPASQRLPSSRSTATLLSSRIPTPGGYRRTPKYAAHAGEAMPAPSVRTGDYGARQGANRLDIEHEPLMFGMTDVRDEETETGRDERSMNAQATPDVMGALSTSSGTSSLGAMDPTGVSTSLKGRRNIMGPQTNSKRPNKGGYSRLSVPQLRVASKWEGSEPLLAHDDSTPSGQESPRSSFDIVQRGLMKPVDPPLPDAKSAVSLSQPPEVFSSKAEASPRAPPKFKRLASSDNFKWRAPSSPLASAVKSTLRNLTPKSSSFAQTEAEPTFEDMIDESVYIAQPSAYWSGRFVSLRDRYNTQYGKQMYDKSSSDFVASAREHDLSAAIWIFTRLEPLCMTLPATKSLESFKKRYAKKVGMPELLHTSQPSSFKNQQARKSTIWGTGRGNTESGHDEATPTPILTIPRKPLATEEAVLTPKSTHTTDTTETETFVVHGYGDMSQDDSLHAQTLRSKGKGAPLEKERSFIGRMMDFGRKASWTGTNET